MHSIFNNINNEPIKKKSNRISISSVDEIENKNIFETLDQKLIENDDVFFLVFIIFTLISFLLFQEKLL